MILTCPECATSYFAADSAVGEGRMVRCTACGAAWRAAPERPREPKAETEPAALAADPAPPDEELFSKPPSQLPGEALPKAFRARVQASRRMRQAAVQGAVWAGMGASVALVLVLAVVFRADVVRAWPRTAGAYAAVGLAVNPVGLTIEDVHAQPSLQDGHPALMVSGSVRNIRPEALAPPPLKVVLSDKDGHKLMTRKVAAPEGAVPPGQSRRFSFNLIDPPSGAIAADITFAALKAQPRMSLVSRTAQTPSPEPQAMALEVTAAEDAKPLPKDSRYALRQEPAR